MWLMAMFDLPVVTPKQRKAATGFRKDLLNDGFEMMQYSVYVRHCANVENAEVHIKRIEAVLPEEGECRVMMFTDKQFQRMRLYCGQRREKVEPATGQLVLF
ncbi:CRISPR-associated endonuclease Cas2 [bacterium]|nr:CRISPR-associated endonuclease Cas2 [bacterium]